MDFFEAQARAKQRTARLVGLFALAVLGTIVAMYVAAVFIQEATLGQRGALQLWRPQLLAGVALVTLAVVGIASLVKWSQFSGGGGAVAESVGGRRVDPQTTDLHERRLLNVVEEMAIASGVPVPAVYVLDEEPAINAFAAGLTTNDAVVAVTRGTLEKLTREELQGVVGHEFSHILNGDMRLNMRLTALVFGILVLGLTGRGILWSLRNVRVRGKNGGGLIAAIALAGIALLVIGYIGYFFGRLVQAAVSRQREYLADASAVQFTRNPGGLVGALKKIGGYGPGSALQSTKSEAIGHFFFAQGFRSMLGGLWATHPPLDERIRAIDPRFDGQTIAPPELVDATEGASGAAGFTPAKNPPPLPATAATASVAAAGTLTPEQLAHAQLLLETTPPRLRAAAHDPAEAPVLVCGLLLVETPAERAKQRERIAASAGADALEVLDAIEADLGSVRAGQKLPLLQLALPTLKILPPAQRDSLLATIDELVRADAHVTTFEFALQKLVAHALASGLPEASAVRFQSFDALVEPISVLLSALARASVAEPDFARRAFAAGAAQLKVVESRLRFVEAAACSFEQLDAALNQLAQASLPIKRRTLFAAGQVVGADGQVLIAEAELLRTFAAVLDVPMPAVTLAPA